MQIDAQIDDVFFLKKGSTNPMVITLQNQQDKIAIFNNLGKLKGLVNEDDKPFFFSHYMSANHKEQRIREDEIILANNQLPQKDQIDMERKGGVLYIESEPYRKSVEPPTVNEILALSKQDFQSTMAIDLAQGIKIREKNNSFTGYAVSVNDVQEVKKAFTKVNIEHASAKHTICAFRIPGLRNYNANDYVDDGDSGCGRALLNWMEDSDITCKAIFVVRYGEKLPNSTKCFECYLAAASSAIATNPVNSINNVDQSTALAPTSRIVTTRKNTVRAE